MYGERAYWRLAGAWHATKYRIGARVALSAVCGRDPIIVDRVRLSVADRLPSDARFCGSCARVIVLRT